MGRYLHWKVKMALKDRLYVDGPKPKPVPLIFSCLCSLKIINIFYSFRLHWQIQTIYLLLKLANTLPAHSPLRSVRSFFKVGEGGGGGKTKNYSTDR